MLPEYIKFYHHALSPAEQDIYMQVYRNLKERKRKFRVCLPEGTTLPDLLDIYKLVIRDTPAFFYVRTYHAQYQMCSTGFDVTPNYLYTDAEIDRLEKQAMVVIERFKAQYITPDMSEYARELAIHDYLIETVDYAHEIYKAKGVHDDEYIHNHPEIYTALGPLLRHKAVCLGISLAFKLLCDCVRVKSFVVTGKTIWASGADPGHAWNMVQLDGESYHVDATWDIRTRTKRISCCYDYLNLNDQLIRFNHTWSSTRYPKCTALTYNFYRRYKLYVRTLDDIPALLSREYAKGRVYIPFKYANAMSSNEEILECIRKWVRASAYNERYSWMISRDLHNIYLKLG